MWGLGYHVLRWLAASKQLIVFHIAYDQDVFTALEKGLKVDLSQSKSAENKRVQGEGAHCPPGRIKLAEKKVAKCNFRRFKSIHKLSITLLHLKLETSN